MHLARVTGAVVSTQKSPSLIGKKLLLVRRVSADGELPASPTSGDEVAVDSVGAGIGALVAMTAIGGVIMAARIGSGSPSVGDGYELNVISAVVLGGTSQRGGVGGVRGTLIGALTLTMLANGLVLWGMPSEVQLLIKGVVLILAVFISQERGTGAVVK